MLRTETLILSGKDGDMLRDRLRKSFCALGKCNEHFCTICKVNKQIIKRIIGTLIDHKNNC